MTKISVEIDGVSIEDEHERSRFEHEFAMRINQVASEYPELEDPVTSVETTPTITLYRATAFCWSREHQTELELERVRQDRQEAESEALDAMHHHPDTYTDREQLRKTVKYEVILPPGIRNADQDVGEMNLNSVLSICQENGLVVDKEELDT